MTEFLATNRLLPLSFPEPLTSSSSLSFPFNNSHHFINNNNKPFPPKHSSFKPLHASFNARGRSRRRSGSDYYYDDDDDDNNTLYNQQLQFDVSKFQTLGLHKQNDHVHEDGSLGGRRRRTSNHNDKDTIQFDDTKFQSFDVDQHGSEEMIEGGSSRRRKREDEDLVRIQQKGDDGDDLEKDEKLRGKVVVGIRKVKQIIRRSNLLAKQVISIGSALSLGFVSQLWVDTTSWMVLFVEVRPNLLSGDSEKFLLEDISQVGDVVLVQDESVIENEFKMIGLETLGGSYGFHSFEESMSLEYPSDSLYPYFYIVLLFLISVTLGDHYSLSTTILSLFDLSYYTQTLVGYRVVTPSQRNIGKVRGYTFSLNSGAVEELELDSFGISIIPSSLVSTYSLLVEDVLEVISDAVVVSEAAASRIQRLSKGFLGNQNVGTSMDDFEDYDYDQSMTSDNVSRRRKSFGRKKPNQRYWDEEDNWELPMDYL
ncbi:hypothetical protein RIF29_00114 [Crotalaria pallida]|uniref:Uncharacterized protein n=1 Tax=Crotalaria pallida TaxID=3830 RepID=A0AAN9IVC8_CROPI